MSGILIAFRQQPLDSTLSSDYAFMPSGMSDTPSLSQERDFYKIAEKMHTDKVAANYNLPGCLKNSSSCFRKGCIRKECQPWGHFYNTIYQKRFGQYSTDNVEPFQFLEIGFSTGYGYDAFNEFMPKAEAHSIEISCKYPLPEGWVNSARSNKRYQEYLDAKRLHCGNAVDVNFLHKVWTTEMNRTDAPPLKIVVDDASHLAAHMAQSVFFWFPRIQPRGLMVVEDIQPIVEANKFRTQFLPQIMSDLHYCGDPAQPPDTICFPTLQPLLASIHCEMHICIFERNDEPAVELSLNESIMPKGALDLNTCQALSKSF